MCHLNFKKLQVILYQSVPEFSELISKQQPIKAPALIITKIS